MQNINPKWMTIAILILTILSTISQENHIYAQQGRTTIHRDIIIMENYATIVDTINAYEPIENITQYIPKQYVGKIFTIRAYDENGDRNIIIENDTDRYKVIVLGKTLGEIIIETYLIEHLQYSANKYVFTYPLYPISNIIIDECNVTIIYPPSTTEITIIPPTNITNSTTKPLAEYHQKPLPPETFIELYTSFKAKITPITIEELRREINIDQQISIKEEIKIKNVSGRTIAKSDGIKISIPKGFIVKEILDPIGRLNYKENTTNNEKILTIHPRIDIQNQYTYEYTIEYTMAREELVTGAEQQKLKVMINTINSILTKRLNIKVTFNPGTKILQTDITPTIIRENEIEYQLQKIIGIEKDINITYIPGPTPTQVPLTQITYATIAAIIASTIYIQYRRGKGKKRISEREYIEELYGTYLSKRETYMKIKELIEKYGREEINKRNYLEGKGKQKTKIRELDEKINEIKLKITSEEIKRKTMEIDDEIIKMEKLMEQMEDLEERKLSKTIRRIQYQQGKNMNERTYNRIMRRIETKINELIEIKA